jgi:hypothetical protein
MQNYQNRDDEQHDIIDAKIAAFSTRLLDTRDEDVSFRAASGIERIWREDQRAHDGIDGTEGRDGVLDAATGESWPGRSRENKRRSRVVLNLIRSKCETKEGRFSEIMLPTDDRNWGLKTTPVTDISPINDAGGFGLLSANSMDDNQAEQIEPDDADKRTSLMELEVDDQLNESDFNGECRKVARQSIQLGTGVLKGPNVIKRVKKSWTEQRENGESIHIIKIVEEMKPASKFVDVWDVYPAAGWDGNPDNLSRVWEKSSILPRELESLIGVDGYNGRQIMKVLEEEPLRTSPDSSDKGSGLIRKNQVTIKRGAPYERWEYYGDADKEFLELMGCSCGMRTGRVSVSAVFVNDRPIKIQLNTLDTGDIPYDFFQWIPQNGIPWGMSEPRRLMYPQRIATGALRMMMDNSGDSAGRQIIINHTVEPQDGAMTYENNKIWINTDESVPANQAFAQFQLANNQQQYENIINIAIRLADMESGTSLLAQGSEKGTAPETLGGMKLLMNNSDSNIRAKIKQWDDCITRRHLKRYYDWNMQYNPKGEIKGDMQVDPRGVSILLVKDDNVQKLMGIFSLRGDPEVNIQVDWGKVIEQLFKSQHLDVLKSDEEIKAAREQAQQQPAPMAPQIEAAKIRIEGDMQKAQLVQQSDMAELQLKEKIETSSLVLKHKMMQEERAHQMQIKEMEVQLKMMELAQNQEISLDSIKAALSSDMMKLKTQEKLSLMSDNAKQVSMPETEPAGQAQPGHAYEQ